MKKNPVVHFEMPYENSARVSEFYKNAFGWDMIDAGEGMGNYVLATTTETDPQTTRPTTPGAINGGFYKKSDSPNPYPSVVISVDNIEEGIESVKKAGGEVVGEPVEIPGVGMWVVFTDTEGNKASMLQPAGM